jgi:hypothetical protein
METFVQYPQNTPIIRVQNCFSCHNAVSFSSKSPPLAPIQPRLVAVSHMLAEGSPYEVPNLISGRLPLKSQAPRNRAKQRAWACNNKMRLLEGRKQKCFRSHIRASRLSVRINE